MCAEYGAWGSNRRLSKRSFCQIFAAAELGWGVNSQRQREHLGRERCGVPRTVLSHGIAHSISFSKLDLEPR